jgi:uncharacterized protein YeaO (DUF488 family)
MAITPEIRLRRVYDAPTSSDGLRILVDRVWPRGLSKAAAHIDEWCKHVAPSTQLRKWYGHDPDRFAEFSRRYSKELDYPERAAALRHLHELARGQTVTLLTATKNVETSHAAVLSELIAG